MWQGPPPWPHQEQALSACLDLLQLGRGRGLVQMPTGTGKSRLMRAITYHLLDLSRNMVLALPTEEILGQFAQDFRRECQVPFYIEKAEKAAPLYARIILASQQTIWRRLPYYDPRQVLLFDEAHHTNGQALKNLSTLLRFHLALGYTASAWSEECEAVYQNRVLYEYPLSQAIKDGYLCPYEVRPFPEVVPRPRGHELYYCANNAQAKVLSRRCPGSAYLGYDVPGKPEAGAARAGVADRQTIVEKFRQGVILRLYVNRMLTEGFDCPEVGTIYIDKAPGSDILNYQMVGRGLRKKKSGGGLVVYAQDPAGLLLSLARAG